MASIRLISVASNAIQTIDNETANLIIYCLNCIQHGGNSTYETGLMVISAKLKAGFHFNRIVPKRIVFLCFLALEWN